MSDRIPLQELVARSSAEITDIAGMMQRGNYWNHPNSNGLYVVKGYCFREFDLTLCVIYEDVIENVPWCRPYVDFVDGRFREVSTDD